MKIIFNPKYMGLEAKSHIHIHIMDLMQALGYPISRSGVCFGFVILASSSIFNNRFDEFLNSVAATSHLDCEGLGKNAKNDTKNNPLYLSLALPLLDGIYYAQRQPRNAMIVTPRNSRRTENNITQLYQVLCDKPNHIINLACFEKFYTFGRLERNIRDLLKRCEKITHPVSFIICGPTPTDTHAITLAYYPQYKENHLLALDINEYPVDFSNQPHSIADYIWQAYNHGQYAGFNAVLLRIWINCDIKAKTNIQSQLDPWIMSQTSTNTFDVMTLDANEAKYHYIGAIRSVALDLIAQLMDHPSVNINETDSHHREDTSLHVAASCNDLPLVQKILGKEGVDLTIKDKDGMTAEALAEELGMEDGSEQVMQLFIDYRLAQYQGPETRPVKRIKMGK